MSSYSTQIWRSTILKPSVFLKNKTKKNNLTNQKLRKLKFEIFAITMELTILNINFLTLSYLNRFFSDYRPVKFRLNMSSNEPTEEPIIHPFISLGLGWPKSLLIVIDHSMLWVQYNCLSKIKRF